MSNSAAITTNNTDDLIVEQSGNVVLSNRDGVLYEKDSSFKSFMDYNSITDKNSTQWYLQQGAYTDEYGLRKINDYYCVALGKGLNGQLGDKFIIQLESGQAFKGVICDLKQEIHTDETNTFALIDEARINVVEFIVEYKRLPEMVKLMGDISYTPNKLFEGNIVEIRRLDEENIDN